MEAEASASGKRRRYWKGERQGTTPQRQGQTASLIHRERGMALPKERGQARQSDNNTGHVLLCNWNDEDMKLFF